MLVAYDGSRFHGWQRQDGYESVQEALEDAVEAATGDPVTVRGSGRTDTGVHALGQVANFHTATQLDDGVLCRALNAHLDEGVQVRRLETCDDQFHAQKSARGKRYAYVVHTTRSRPPFARELAHWTSDPLDLRAMRDAAAAMCGTRDFAAFASAGSPRATTVRTVSRLRVVARRDRIAFVVQGSGFLYNQVRTMAGTLLEAGRGRIDAAGVEEVLASADRRRAPATAPAAGLWLLSVQYDEPVFSGRWRGPRGAPGAFP